MPLVFVDLALLALNVNPKSMNAHPTLVKTAQPVSMDWVVSLVLVFLAILVLFAKSTSMNAVRILVKTAVVWMKSINTVASAIQVFLDRCVRPTSMNVPPILAKTVVLVSIKLTASSAFALLLTQELFAML
jgi:hypothetical protein